MASCSNLDSLSRKPPCPVTCCDGIIRPPRGGAPSCGTRHLRSGRSVLAKQVGHHTSFLPSSADGSRDLSGASRRCGIASLAGLSSYRPPCIRRGRIALPIVLLGAIRPPLRATAIGRSTTFSVSLEGVTEQDAGIHKFCTTVAIARTRQATHISYQAVCIARLPRTTRSETNDPRCPSEGRKNYRPSIAALF
jgi:hypothetical protein